MRPRPLYTKMSQLLRQPWFEHARPVPQLSLSMLARTLFEYEKALCTTKMLIWCMVSCSKRQMV